jgi:hypothetical protein
MTRPLELTGEQILAYRRAVQALDERLPPGPDSLRRAAWAGLQDSVPRSALHALHARIEGVAAGALDDPALVQVWGPRYTVYVVPASDHVAFTLGRLPERGPTRKQAEELAARLREHLDGRTLPYGEAGRALGVHPNSLRYAALTGTVLIRWEGARQPMVWTVARPEIDPLAARKELVCRFLHVHGPSTPGWFARWAGVSLPAATVALDAVRRSLLAVRTPLGEAYIVATDEPAFRAPPSRPAAARLLPSGDPYFLLQGPDRELLVPQAERRAQLWTPRVWPGAVLADGEIVGTWRRDRGTVTIQTWMRLSRERRQEVEHEAQSLPLPGVQGPIVTRWGSV